VENGRRATPIPLRFFVAIATQSTAAGVGHQTQRRIMTVNSLKQSLKVRPNTGLPENLLQDNMIICTGEDPSELVHAMRTVLPDEKPHAHQYRCYRAWKFRGFTVVISGIGTGCLEPLMFELLDHKILGNKVAKRLVLIGTAGYLADSGSGKVYLVEGAYPIGCGVTLEEHSLPVRPHFKEIDKIQLPRAEEISTDYYYGCSLQNTDERTILAKKLNPALRQGIEKHWKSGRLISMETAQFYHFASIYGLPGTQYIALRGVANLADQFQTQGDNSLQVLEEAFRQAVQLLRK
jgi:hypothetical protein